MGTALGMPELSHDGSGEQLLELWDAPAMNVLYCSNCGHGNPPGTTYCQACGKMLNP